MLDSGSAVAEPGVVQESIGGRAFLPQLSAALASHAGCRRCADGWFQRNAALTEPPGLESIGANRSLSGHNEQVGKTPLEVVKRLRGAPFSTILAKCVDSALFLASPSV